MKKIILLVSLIVFFSLAHGQILKKIANKVKNKVENPSNKSASDSTDVKKDDKNPANETNKPDTAKNENAQPAAVSIKAYSKYDFVPGEKVIGFEDFSTGSIGDFPAGWNTNASGEIVTIEGKPGHWLWLTKPGQFIPEFTEQYPEDFTFEFDLLHGVPINGAYFNICFAELSNISQFSGWPYATNQFNIELNNANTGTELSVSRFSARRNSVTDVSGSSNPTILSDKNNPVHIAIWRQKERVRVYANQEKIWDIPKATIKEAKFNAIIFSVTYADATIQHYIGNLRMAVGAPDTRNKFLTQNKWVTHGILFDVNSANIKPESYGSLKEIANVLKENPDLKVKIVGHTDADGKDADNLDLSKRRAASVKTALANEFGIDESRMETDGKGESEPIDKNDTPAGKANNRRVEFIKM